MDILKSYKRAETHLIQPPSEGEKTQNVEKCLIMGVHKIYAKLYIR